MKYIKNFLIKAYEGSKLVTQVDANRRVEPNERLGTVIAHLALVSCFFITHFTNGILIRVIGKVLEKGAEWHPAGQMIATVGDRAGQYFLGSVKDCIFTLALLVFGFLLRKPLGMLPQQIARNGRWRDIAISLFVASLFLLMLRPAGMGLNYAEVSVEPFLMEPGYYHRRILMPVLAHGLHLSGVLYGVFFWAVFILVCLFVNVYLATRGVVLSRLELASLYTTGVFASSLGLPGYGEILVLGFTLLAMLEFERTGRAGTVQVVCFGLALLTHESAATLAFGTLSLCLFGWRSILHFGLLLACYLGLFWLSFGLDEHAAWASQLTGGESNASRFLHVLPLVVLSLATVWKLGLLAAAVAVARSVVDREFRTAGIVLLAISGSLALSVIATDTTRMFAFGTFGLLLALPWALPRLSVRQRQWFAAVNLLLPTLYVSANKGVHTYNGLYGLVFKPLIH
nr:hypothetical protein [uncultured Rhodoferax sp.]